jgi:sulfoxide reductase heme-binding subunit YedZ
MCTLAAGPLPEAKMSRIRSLLDSRYTFWALLCAPGLWITLSYARGTTFYGEILHASGDLAAQLLIATLALTPLRLLFSRALWTTWLLRRRRYLGVAAFAYALLHTIVYRERLGNLDEILAQALETAMWTGWLALAVMLPLALTSNDVSVRRLGHAWKTLHRLAYIGAVLTLAHWYFAAFDPTPGLIYFGLLGCLEIFRLWASRANLRRRPT